MPPKNRFSTTCKQLRTLLIPKGISVEYEWGLYA